MVRNATLSMAASQPLKGNVYICKVDRENDNLSQPEYTDMELRDIRYRLNVLDHKLDTVLSKLDGQEEVIRRSDSRWQSISVFLESIGGFMEAIMDYMRTIGDHYSHVRGHLAKILRLMHIRARWDFPDDENQTVLERVEEVLNDAKIE